MPAHAAEYVKTLLAQSNPRISVQKMCDDTGLPKSTIDKFLAGQTFDTGWNNVMVMVKYLGGSLDTLADIQKKAVQEAQANPVPQKADNTALTMLVESYKQEIQRIESYHQNTLDRFRRVNEESRAALIDQHKTEAAHIADKCSEIVKEKVEHFNSMRKGRDFWRTLACCMIAALVLIAVWLVWEFSNFDKGLTGHYLRMILQQSLAGGAS